MRRAVTAVLAAGLVTLSCAACNDDSASGGSAQVSTELSGIQSTLDGIDSDMAGDGNP
ncbi:hypothetical protein [Amycolatopsis sp. H20-H5]|uniref:hypothetical protein n=1 Tax=Amycolatopsis sp. H20-H5 TaxID=3046309 RepID=UPI002DBC2DB1|nr:hypothetical protein [Amycolatopsis sp. H20-H5]MEC3977463.1 hypothetical protein [Amycolatopsis sp. H20-H5]